MHVRVAAIFLLTILPFLSQAQDYDEIPYHTETGIGINFNTNGGLLGGIMAKRSVHIRKNMYHFFGLEIVNVKHPKELRYASPVTGNTFIYFKENYLFSIRPMYGREFLLFRKSDEEGVRVSGLLAGGLTFGLVKPYAIQYDYTSYTGTIGSPTDVRNEPYDPKIHTNPTERILGTGGLLTAINKSKIYPGLCAKAGLSFEFGNSTTGVEVGGLVEMFPKTIPLMAVAQNYKVFTSIYINIYYAIRD